VGKGSDKPGVEIAVAQAERMGIPTLIEFLQNGPSDAGNAAGMGALPARYRKLWQELVSMNTRQDQATILCREAWMGDPSLDTPPWDRIRAVLERDTPCSLALDLSNKYVLGLAGAHRTGRTTVAVELCRMAAELLPGKVALLSTGPRPEMEIEGVKSLQEGAPERAAKLIAQDESLHLIVIDMPAMGPSRAGLLTIPWLNAFDSMSLVPVVTADELTEGIAMVNAVAEFESLGWIMTFVDGVDHMGALLSLALASNGPFGFVGKFNEEDDPQLELARWDSVVNRMENHVTAVDGPDDGSTGGDAP